MKLTTQDILQALKGKTLRDSYQQSFLGVSTDSRQKQNQKLFFAIKGNNFDGHDFISQALKQGATGFVLSNTLKLQNFLKQNQQELFVLQVPDVLKALQDLACFWREKTQLKVLAVTGSNGKTTTIHFAKTLFANQQACISPKSYNNHFGVPLSILSADKINSFLIQEVGTSAAGEIAHLKSLCQPLASVVTTVGLAHLEGLGSIQNIAKEKEDIYSQDSDSIWIFNRDNPYTEEMFQKRKNSKNKIITLSQTGKDATLQFQFTKQEFNQAKIEGHIDGHHFKTSVAFVGAHHLNNLMCACALALSAKLSPEEIVSKIPDCQLPAGRSQHFAFKDKKSHILFDAYNANPTSMHAFFETCKQAPFKQKYFVLGDMKELGLQASQYHKDLAKEPELITASWVWFVGDYGEVVEQALKEQGFQGTFLKTQKYQKQHLEELQNLLQKESLLALKASRSLQLEKLFFDLTGSSIAI